MPKKDRRRKLSLEVIAKDPIGAIFNVLLPKAIVEADSILWKHLPPTHPDFAKLASLKVRILKDAGNLGVALKSVGIQDRKTDQLSELLERLRSHDARLAPADRARLEKLIEAKDGVMIPVDEDQTIN